MVDSAAAASLKPVRRGLAILWTKLVGLCSRAFRGIREPSRLRRHGTL
jgi:hypothetical protein